MFDSVEMSVELYWVCGTSLAKNDAESPERRWFDESCTRTTS